MAQVFSCEFCAIFKNTSFYETRPVAASLHSYTVFSNLVEKNCAIKFTRQFNLLSTMTFDEPLLWNCIFAPIDINQLSFQNLQLTIFLFAATFNVHFFIISISILIYVFIYNPGHNILELYNILVHIQFTTSKRKLDI